MRLPALFLAFLASTSLAVAQEQRPDDLVRKVTADVLAAVQSDKVLASGDRKKALELAESKILPHVDFREAARLAVSRSWASASPQQQDRLVQEFRSMLVRLYSTSIEAYRGQSMKVQPARMSPGDTDAMVRNQYIRPGQPPIVVDYAMRKTPEGWKIYDIVIEGVSLVLTYRAEFEQVAREAGVDGLIRRMAEKNRAG